VFMTGFYSKDFILESAYGQFYFSSTVVYFIATIGAMFTTLYSVKVLYLTFLTNPAGPVVNYKQAHEGNIFMSVPLIILAIFSIFFGYITKDIFIGLGSGFFADNGLFIHPSHEIMLDTEFAVPGLFKLLPLIFTILLSVLSIVFSEFFPKVLIYFKFSRSGYNIFSFFNQRFYIELFYNKYITDVILKLGGQTTKVLDKGSIELIGPFGLEKGLLYLSRNIASLDTGVITSYALYILIGLTFYILIPYLTNNNILIIILFGLFGLLELNKSYISNAWAISSPPKPHTFVSLPLQSSLNKDCLSVYVELLNINQEYNTIASTFKSQMEKWDATFSTEFIDSDVDVTINFHIPYPDSDWVTHHLASNLGAIMHTREQMEERIVYMNSNTELDKNLHLKAKYFELINSHQNAFLANKEFLGSRFVIK